uniref:GCF C-terminal domain-containing protein n=1 Tax=Caenorhabditis japonica TaxID=281687 RepID=A0A8R1I4Q5_CAEJA
MFRKPKAKGAIRQRKTDTWDEENEEKPNERSIEIKPTPPRATISFDADEGADSAFKLKKDKKKVEELKKQQKLEEEAEKFRLEEKERKLALEKVIKKEKESKEEKRSAVEKKKYLDKYRDKSAKHITNSEHFEYEEHLDIDSEAVTSSRSKFSSIFEGIPDSRAVFEAKKRRERARTQGDGYVPIPLDDTQKYKKSSKSERNRLIREDENDDSDEECPNNFYSARELLKSEEERKREEQEDFLERENGEIEETQRRRDEGESEEDEWEKQQIQKAVSGRKIGQLRTEKRNTAKLFGHAVPVEDDTEMDMDIDMDVDMEFQGKPSYSGPTNTGGEIKLEDILAKLKFRIEARDEALNFRKEEKRKLEQNLEENRQMIGKIEMELPSQSTKYTMYQELRVYSRCLLECLNEKVAEINQIIDKKRNCGKSRTNRLVLRRRQDMRDQHVECAQGKRNGEAVQRAAEREARRGRRRRERESTLAGISHEEGLSTDDEEPTHQTMIDQKTCDEVEAVASILFADALDEYSDLGKVLGRIIDWLAVDSKSFQDAYVYMCIPKLCSPYVRLEMLRADVLKNETSVSSMQWFRTVILAGSENSEIDQNHEILIELAPAIVEKVVIPFLIDTVKEEWDPLSLRQTKNLANFCSIFEKLPNLNEKSKQFNAFLNTIRTRICECISDDLFIPIFTPSALDTPNCRQFHDRQFWICIKLIKCINALSPLISSAARFELVFDKIVNTHCIISLRSGAKNDVAAERKTRGLIQQLDDSLLMMGGITSYRQLSSSFELIADAQKEAGRYCFKGNLYGKKKFFIEWNNYCVFNRLAI